MAYCVLFHSVLGLRPAVHAAAERLVRAGHTVLTADLLSGHVADNLADGVALRDTFGRDKLINRGHASVFDVQPGAVYLGLSFGATVALHVAERRGDAAGVVLLHGAPQPAAAWPHAVPVAVHSADPDEYVDRAELTSWAERGAEVHTYARCSHLFTDPDYAERTAADAQAAEDMWRRVEHFIARLDAPAARPVADPDPDLARRGVPVTSKPATLTPSAAAPSSAPSTATRLDAVSPDTTMPIRVDAVTGRTGAAARTETPPRTDVSATRVDASAARETATPADGAARAEAADRAASRVPVVDGAVRR